MQLYCKLCEYMTPLIARLTDSVCRCNIVRADTISLSSDTDVGVLFSRQTQPCDDANPEVNQGTVWAT